MTFVDDEVDMPPYEDPDLASVWPSMTPEENLRFYLARGEEPPAGLRERVRGLYDEPT